MIDMLQAFEKFVQVKDFGDGAAFKKDGVRGSINVGKAGAAAGTRSLNLPSSGAAAVSAAVAAATQTDPASSAPLRRAGSAQQTESLAREALRFFFSPEGVVFRDMILDETCSAIDSISRDAAREVVFQLGIDRGQVPSLLRALAPKLSEQDRKVVAGIRRLASFLVTGGSGDAPLDVNFMVSSSMRPENRAKFQQLLPVLREFSPSIRSFGQQILRRLVDRATSRVLTASSKAIFGVAA
jgi:aarF domain-containing kinase